MEKKKQLIGLDKEYDIDYNYAFDQLNKYTHFMAINEQKLLANFLEKLKKLDNFYSNGSNEYRRLSTLDDTEKQVLHDAIDTLKATIMLFDQYYIHKDIIFDEMLKLLIVQSGHQFAEKTVAQFTTLYYGHLGEFLYYINRCHEEYKKIKLNANNELFKIIKNENGMIFNGLYTNFCLQFLQKVEKKIQILNCFNTEHFDNTFAKEFNQIKNEIEAIYTFINELTTNTVSKEDINYCNTYNLLLKMNSLWELIINFVKVFFKKHMHIINADGSRLDNNTENITIENVKFFFGWYLKNNFLKKVPKESEDNIKQAIDKVINSQSDYVDIVNCFNNHLKDFLTEIKNALLNPFVEHLFKGIKKEDYFKIDQNSQLIIDTQKLERLKKDGAIYHLILNFIKENKKSLEKINFDPNRFINKTQSHSSHLADCHYNPVSIEKFCTIYFVQPIISSLNIFIARIKNAYYIRDKIDMKEYNIDIPLNYTQELESLFKIKENYEESTKQILNNILFLTKIAHHCNLLEKAIISKEIVSLKTIRDHFNRCPTILDSKKNFTEYLYPHKELKAYTEWAKKNMLIDCSPISIPMLKKKLVEALLSIFNEDSYKFISLREITERYNRYIQQIIPAKRFTVWHQKFLWETISNKKLTEKPVSVSLDDWSYIMNINNMYAIKNTKNVP